MGRPIRLEEPDSYYMITNRCTRGLHLLHPDETVNSIIRGCVAWAAQAVRGKDARPVCFTFLGNHFHLIAGFVDRNRSEFVSRFTREIARRVNNYRGTSGPMFAERAEPKLLLDDETLLQKICYVVNNPLRHNIVPSAGDWPGVSSWRCHRTGAPFVGDWLNGKLLNKLRKRKGSYGIQDAMERYSLELHVPTALDGDDREERRRNLVRLIVQDRRRIWKERTGDPTTAPETTGLIGSNGQLGYPPWKYMSDEPEGSDAPSRLCDGIDDQEVEEYVDKRRALEDEYDRAVRNLRNGRSASFPGGTFPPGLGKSVDP